jgi:hypothetical protein
MMVDKTVSKSKKSPKVKTSAKNLKKEAVSEVIIEKNTPDNSETDVSVFTKTRSPKVVIQTEDLENKKLYKNQNICSCRLLKFVCLIIMSIIVLMTFFLSLKTYTVVNELSALLN